MASSSQGLRVLIVEDNATFAIALQMLIETDGRFEVIGRASNGNEAFNLAATRRPDIVTMDIRMPVRDGVEATRMITAYLPATAVVVISAWPSLADEALAAGAVANVPKDDVADHLLSVLGAIADRLGRAGVHVPSLPEDVARPLHVEPGRIPSPAPSARLGEHAPGRAAD